MSFNDYVDKEFIKYKNKQEYESDYEIATRLLFDIKNDITSIIYNNRKGINKQEQYDNVKNLFNKSAILTKFYEINLDI